MKKSKSIENIVWVCIPFLSPAVCFFLSLFMYRQYKEDPIGMAWAVGSTCFVFGALIFLTLKICQPVKRLKGKCKVLQIEFTVEATERIYGISKYLEHTSFEETIEHLLIYFEESIEVYRGGSKIMIRKPDGTEKEFNPVTLQDEDIPS